MQKDGEVSLGKNGARYQALIAKLQKELADPDQDLRPKTISLLCQVFRTAHDKKLPGVAADVKTFAFKIVPPAIKQQTYYYAYYYHDMEVNDVSQTVHDLAGPLAGFEFLLNSMESEPRWLRYNNQDGWRQHAYTLGLWRNQALDAKESIPGEMEGWLLKLVLAELRRDLETREQRSPTFYFRGDAHNAYPFYWYEKEADFAKTAEEVLAQRSQSGAAVQYIASYFYWNISRKPRAIEILFAAHKQKLLDEEGQAKLVDFLHGVNRYGESIPLLKPLIERRPENLNYRVLLMHAIYRTAPKELLALLKETDAFFHEKDRWTEPTIHGFAKSTLENRLFEQSVGYFKELIALHERTQPNRGIGNDVLAGYYSDLAEAYAGLNKTPEAVEAAGGAIVAWGADRRKRGDALETLKNVLLRSPDLDAFVAHFDKEKQDSAIIRKALGQAYGQKKEWAKAIQQLEKAAQLQPNDAEVHRLLVSFHDETGDKQGAIGRLLQAVQVSRRDIKLYEDLGRRYAALGQANEAERAYTSIVEVLPTESESHALLATIREKQNRWKDAIEHWEQVARLRSLEPTGLLRLAAAQIHEKQWDKARETLRQLDTRTWPARFGNVQQQVDRLRLSILER